MKGSNVVQAASQFANREDMQQICWFSAIMNVCTAACLFEFCVANIASRLLARLSSPEHSVTGPLKSCWEITMSHLYFRCKKTKSNRLHFFCGLRPKGKEQHVWVGERQSGCSPDVSGCFSESWSGLREDLQTCVKTNNKSQKQELKPDKSCWYLSAVSDQTQTQWVSFFSHPHTIPPYVSAQFPTVPPVTLAKVLDEKRTGRKRKTGTKDEDFFSVLEEQRGWLLLCSGKEASTALNQCLPAWLSFVLCVCLSVLSALQIPVTRSLKTTISYFIFDIVTQIFEKGYEYAVAMWPMHWNRTVSQKLQSV